LTAIAASAKIMKQANSQTPPAPPAVKSLYTGPEIDPMDLDADNPLHLAFLESIGILIDRSNGGVRLIHYGTDGSKRVGQGCYDWLRFSLNQFVSFSC
jgi:hypothetical protein